MALVLGPAGRLAVTTADPVTAGAAAGSVGVSRCSTRSAGSPDRATCAVGISIRNGWWCWRSLVSLPYLVISLEVQPHRRSRLRGGGGEPLGARPGTGSVTPPQLLPGRGVRISTGVCMANLAGGSPARGHPYRPLRLPAAGDRSGRGGGIVTAASLVVVVAAIGAGCVRHADRPMPSGAAWPRASCSCARSSPTGAWTSNSRKPRRG